MTIGQSTVEQLSTLAAHLADRREAILQAWREAVDADPELAAASTLSILQFRDRISEVLESFERLLVAGQEARQPEIKEQVAEHGLHRWKMGLSARELAREWGHLEISLLRELDRYERAHPDIEPEVMPIARRMWVRLCNEGISEGVGRFSALLQTEAAGHLRDLQAAMESLKQLERQRAEVWREAAHDLRGNVGLVATTTSLLSEAGLPEPLRTRAMSRLQNSVSTLHQLLEDLMSLARLEAGREHRNVEPFDAAATLAELCATLEPFAQERGLFLRWDGPSTLPVEGDAAKVLRIAQNLILNALKYTTEGGVTVTWAETWERDVERWRLRVEDTGPGFYVPGAPIAAELRKATASARELEEGAPEEQVEPIPGSSSAAPAPPPPHQAPGEGIGLSIVKRLCELLDAGLQVTSEAGKGTTFQVVLPRRYEPRPGLG